MQHLYTSVDESSNGGFFIRFCEGFKCRVTNLSLFGTFLLSPSVVDEQGQLVPLVNDIMPRKQLAKCRQFIQVPSLLADTTGLFPN